MHDGGSRFAPDEPASDDRGGGAPRQRLQAIVHEESPVGIPIEGHPEVRLLSLHQRQQITKVLRLQRIGRVVGEGPVRFEIQAQQLGPELVEHGRQHHSGHAVAAIDGHPQGADPFGVDDPEQVGDVAGNGIELLDGAGGLRRRQDAPSQGLDLLQTGVGTHGSGPFPAQLDPVPFRRIVRGGDHRPRKCLTA